MGVDGARHTVLSLDVQLGDSVLGVNRGLGQVTHSRSFDHVADNEALDGLVLGDAASAVQAANRVDVATAVLGASSVSSLGGLNEWWLAILRAKNINKALGWMDGHGREGWGND